MAGKFRHFFSLSSFLPALPGAVQFAPRRKWPNGLCSLAHCSLQCSSSLVRAERGAAAGGKASTTVFALTMTSIGSGGVGVGRLAGSGCNGRTAERVEPSKYARAAADGVARQQSLQQRLFFRPLQKIYLAN